MVLFLSIRIVISTPQPRFSLDTFVCDKFLGNRRNYEKVSIDGLEFGEPKRRKGIKRRETVRIIYSETKIDEETQKSKKPFQKVYIRFLLTLRIRKEKKLDKIQSGSTSMTFEPPFKRKGMCPLLSLRIYRRRNSFPFLRVLLYLVDKYHLCICFSVK